MNNTQLNVKTIPATSSNQLPLIDERQLALNSQPAVFFKQPSVWSRALIWGLVSLTTCTVAWASLAKMEKVIPAAGKLEPKDAVKEIQAPVSGVVAEVFVEDGEKVAKGDVLLQFDRTTVKAQIKSLERVKQAIVAENNFYRQQMQL